MRQALFQCISRLPLAICNAFNAELLCQAPYADAKALAHRAGFLIRLEIVPIWRKTEDACINEIYRPRERIKLTVFAIGVYKRKP